MTTTPAQRAQALLEKFGPVTELHRTDDPLPAFDFGGSLRVDAKELDLWVDRHRLGAA